MGELWSSDRLQAALQEEILLWVVDCRLPLLIDHAVQSRIVRSQSLGSPHTIDVRLPAQISFLYPIATTRRKLSSSLVTVAALSCVSLPDQGPLSDGSNSADLLTGAMRTRVESLDANGPLRRGAESSGVVLDQFEWMSSF